MESVHVGCHLQYFRSDRITLRVCNRFQYLHRYGTTQVASDFRLGLIEGLFEREETVRMAF